MSMWGTVSPRQDCANCGKEGGASNVLHLNVASLSTYNSDPYMSNESLYVCDWCLLGALSVFRPLLKEA